MTRRHRSSPFSLFAFQDIITSVTGIMILVTLMLTIELLHRKEASPAVQTAAAAERLQTTLRRNDDEIRELRERLARDERAILEVAAIDPRQVHARLVDLTELTAQLESELSDLKREQVESQERRDEIRQHEERRRNDAQTLEQIVEQLRRKREQLQRLKQSNRTVYNAAPGVSKSAWLVELSDAGLTAAPMGKVAPPQKFADATAFRKWAAGRNADREYFVLLIKPQGIDAFQQTVVALRRLTFDVGYDLLSADQTAIDPETGAGIPGT